MSETATRIPAAQDPGKQHRPLREVKTIGEALRHPEVVSRFTTAIPKHLNPERMLRVMVLAVSKTPKLAECDIMGLLGAMLVLTSMGLEPNTAMGHAYLIPFEKRGKVDGVWQTVSVDVQVVVGYRGYIDLMRRSGSMTALHADVVYEGDEFSFEYGSNAHLRHIPKGVRENRRPLWVYCHAKLSDGQAFEVLPYGEVLKIRDNSEGFKSALRGKDRNPHAFAKNPWVAFEHEMAAKTMVRRLAKYAPMSIELSNAAAIDAMSEAGKGNFGEWMNAKNDQLNDIQELTYEHGSLYTSDDYRRQEEDDAEKEPAQTTTREPDPPLKTQEQPTQTATTTKRTTTKKPAEAKPADDPPSQAEAEQKSAAENKPAAADEPPAGQFDEERQHAPIAETKAPAPTPVASKPAVSADNGQLDGLNFDE